MVEDDSVVPVPTRGRTVGLFSPPSERLPALQRAHEVQGAGKGDQHGLSTQDLTLICHIEPGGRFASPGSSSP